MRRIEGDDDLAQAIDGLRAFVGNRLERSNRLEPRLMSSTQKVRDEADRMRHFGFLANRSKKQNLSRCRQLLGVSAPPANPVAQSALELMRELTGVDFSRCPHCHRGTLVVIQILPAAAPSPLIPRMDSS